MPPRPFWTHIFPSTPYSQIPSAYVPLSMWATNSRSKTYCMNVSQHDNFLPWSVVSISPNPQAGGPRRVGCPRLLIQYILIYHPYWRPFLHPQPEDPPCRGDRELLITDINTYTYKIQCTTSIKLLHISAHGCHPQDVTVRRNITFIFLCSVTPYGWQPCVETCRSLILVMYCIILRAFLGGYTDDNEL